VQRRVSPRYNSLAVSCFIPDAQIGWFEFLPYLYPDPVLGLDYLVQHFLVCQRVDQHGPQDNYALGPVAGRLKGRPGDEAAVIRSQFPVQFDVQTVYELVMLLIFLSAAWAFSLLE